MGANFSNFSEKNLTTFVQSEYEKYKSSKKRDYMVLSDVLSINLPEEYPFNFFHLGNLFNMDQNKDGRFSLEDLLQFSQMALKQVKKYK